MAEIPRFTSFVVSEPAVSRGGPYRAPAVAKVGATPSTDAQLVVEAEVFEVLEGFGLAHLRAPDGRVYGINRRTRGVHDFQSLHEGQRYRCEVTRKFGQVLRADLIA